MKHVLAQVRKRLRVAADLQTDNPCWKGYHPVGTKEKDGRTVPNCVPIESAAVSATPPKKLKHGLLLYVSDDGLSLAFDNVSYEFDDLESTLDLFAGVPKAQVLTRTLQSKNSRDMLQSVTSMLQNVPSAPAVTKFFNREFLKSVTKHMQALESASTYLMSQE